MDEPVDDPAPPEEPKRARGSIARLLLKAGAIGAVVGLIALLVWATLAAGKGKSLVGRIAAGEAPVAPAFDIDVIWPEARTWPPPLRPALRDERLSLDELRGHPAVVNFWASWCIPCRDEAPILNASAADHRGEVVFLGIDVQDLRDDALAFLRKYKIAYVSVRDRGDGTYRAYGLTGVPETYYLSADGRLMAHSAGPVSRQTLEAGIQAALEGKPLSQ